MSTDVIWIRVGDSGDYYDCDSTDEVAELLLEYDIRKVWVVGKMGLGAAGFEAKNYISAYWGRAGDAGKPPRRGLNKAEIASINKEIA